jgi:lipopolysaccharide transport system ATP-binding protein
MSGELHVSGIGKAYRQWGGELRRVAAWFLPSIKPVAEHWVLRGVSFSIAPGEAVGIIGQNGAGKSTLLKLITGTTQASEGSLRLSGRVAAILELGMGFNPDLSGRQNAYHSAGLMGYSLAEIEAAMPEIEAFAEIGAYFDQSMRTYSSGMQMRVAFSVATAFRPDLLIVDEALSVGDSYFQHKSFSRIREFREAGTTLLLVSHDRSAIASICDRAILLHEGRVRMDGKPEQVLDLYNAIIAEKTGTSVEQTVDEEGRVRTKSGNGAAWVSNVELFDRAGSATDMLSVGHPVTLELEVTVSQDIDELIAGYQVKNRLGQVIFGTNSFHLGQALKTVKAGETIFFRFHFDANFGNGNFSISTALHSGDNHLTDNYEWHDLASTFSVVNADHPAFVGVAWVPPTLEIVR